jgi:hypothetical protein
MQNCSSNTENWPVGEPHRIGEILAELLAQYQGRFPAARIAVVETPTVTEDQSCSYYPAELVSVS